MTSAARRATGAPLDDRQLVASIARGDMDALGVLYDRNESAVRRFLGRMGVATGDVDDLVQATFLEVTRVAFRYDPGLPARSWLLGIAAMMVRRHRRLVARAVARLVAWASQHRADEPPSPAEQVEFDQAAKRFRDAFEALSPAHREVFTLVTLEGVRGEDVARALGIPINTVWTRLHHARKHLRAHVQEGAER